MNLKTNNLSQILDFGSLFLRISFGLSLLINHGWPAFQKVINGDFGYPDPLGIGSTASLILMASAEFLCALLVTIGLGTKLFSIPVILGFAVAFFVFHSNDPFEEKELAFLYMSAFMSVFFIGGGKYSIDNYLFTKKEDGKNN